MDVGGGEDHSAGGVLGFRELLGEVWDVVVVDEGEGADHGFVGVDVLCEQGVADEIADGLGAVLIAAAGDEAIKLLEEIFFERNASPAELRHCGSPSSDCTGGGIVSGELLS